MSRHISNGKTPQKVPDKARQQKEAADFELARANAERLLTPVVTQPAAPVASAPTEPSLEQRLADIDRRAKERASEEKRALAAHYLTEARNAFRRAVSRTTDEAVKSAYEEMQRLERLAGDTAPAAVDHASAAGKGTGEKATRERRSPDSLRTDAQKLADWLRGHPGSKGSAAVDATGVVVKQPLNVRTFIEKYLPNVKVKTEGQKAGTLYSIG